MFNSQNLTPDKIMDFRFIDFGSFRIGCEEQDMYWLFMYPEALDPREGYKFNAKSSLAMLIKAHAQEKAYKKNSFESILTQRMYLSALREGIYDIAFYAARGNDAFARYHHELAILASENLPDAMGMRKLGDFLKQQYHEKYGEPFNHEVPFTLAMKPKYDPFGNMVMRRIPELRPHAPGTSIERLKDWPCPEKPVLQTIYETIK